MPSLLLQAFLGHDGRPASADNLTVLVRAAFVSNEGMLGGQRLVQSRQVYGGVFVLDGNNVGKAPVKQYLIGRVFGARVDQLLEGIVHATDRNRDDHVRVL